MAADDPIAGNGAGRKVLLEQAEEEHLNLLVKGVSLADVDEFQTAVFGLWCSRVDAEPSAQYVGAISDEMGVVKYVTLHFMKQSQAPVIGWRGNRYSSTRDYLVRPASVMRVEARAALRVKRTLWKAIGRAAEISGGTPWEDLVEVVFEQMEAAVLESDWFLKRIGDAPVPLRWADTGRLARIGGDAVHRTPRVTSTDANFGDEQEPHYGRTWSDVATRIRRTERVEELL